MTHSASTAGRRWPALFIPHGGGPCFFMDPLPGFPADAWDPMAAYLRGIDRSLGGRPDAVVVISGHWEAATPTVNAAARPALLFDYSGFPEHTYRLSYPAPGSPALAKRVRDALGSAGLGSAEDTGRGLDHGVFIPFMLVYPEADVPLVQLSLLQSRNAASHLALGRALAPLRNEGVLIVGSGMSYHNLRGFFVDDPGLNAPAAAFDDWLTAAVTEATGNERSARLADWESAAGARESHPTPEHFLPLLVVAGAAEHEQARRVFSGPVMGKPISAYQFG